MTPIVNRFSVTGEEVNDLIGRIGKALAGEPVHKIVIACLSCAVIAQDPEISEDDLGECVVATSEFMITVLGNDEPIEMGDISRNKMN